MKVEISKETAETALRCVQDFFAEFNGYSIDEISENHELSESGLPGISAYKEIKEALIKIGIEV